MPNITPVWDPILVSLNITCTLNPNVNAFSHNYTSKSPKTNMTAEISMPMRNHTAQTHKNDYIVHDEDGICISRPVNFSIIENNSKMYPYEANYSGVCNDIASNGRSTSRTDEDVYSVINDLKM